MSIFSCLLRSHFPNSNLENFHATVLKYFKPSKFSHLSAVSPFIFDVIFSLLFSFEGKYGVRWFLGMLSYLG